MERKDYLVEELSKEEKLYLKRIVVNVRKKYIRDNYEYINNTNTQLYDYANDETESILDIVIKQYEEEVKSALEFEKIIYNDELRNVVKALSLNEKMVLFSLFKKNQSIEQTAKEMNKDRTTIWRIKNKAFKEIIKKLLGGNKNV